MCKIPLGSLFALLVISTWVSADESSVLIRGHEGTLFIGDDARFVIGKRSNAKNCQILLIENGKTDTSIELPDVENGVRDAALSVNRQHLAVVLADSRVINYQLNKGSTTATKKHTTKLIGLVNLVGATDQGNVVVRSKAGCSLLVDGKETVSYVPENLIRTKVAFDGLDDRFLLMPTGSDDGGVFRTKADSLDDIRSSQYSIQGYNYASGFCSPFPSVCDLNVATNTIASHVVSRGTKGCPGTSALFVWREGTLLDIDRLPGLSHCYDLVTIKNSVFCIFVNKSNQLFLREWRIDLDVGLVRKDDLFIGEYSEIATAELNAKRMYVLMLKQDKSVISASCSDASSGKSVDSRKQKGTADN